MAGGKMQCNNCGKDISMAGSQICEICDPDIRAVIKRGEKPKTPDLCIDCFKNHVTAHEHEHEQAIENCPNCGGHMNNPADSCSQCGYSPAIY